MSFETKSWRNPDFWLQIIQILVDLLDLVLRAAGLA